MHVFRAASQHYFQHAPQHRLQHRAPKKHHPHCQYKALLPDVKMRLPPFLGVDEIVLQQGLIQKTEANEIGWVVSCNNSLTKILELRQQSSECKALVEVLLLQDPLQTLPASLSGELCTNTCSQMIVDKADSALQVCRSSWEQVWATSAYHGMIFKQLLTLASLKYWMYLDCSSNRHRKSCLGAASMQSLEMSDCSAFQVLICLVWIVHACVFTRDKC